MKKIIKRWLASMMSRTSLRVIRELIDENKRFKEQIKAMEEADLKFRTPPSTNGHSENHKHAK